MPGPKSFGFLTGGGMSSNVLGLDPEEVDSKTIGL